MNMNNTELLTFFTANTEVYTNEAQNQHDKKKVNLNHSSTLTEKRHLIEEEYSPSVGAWNELIM